VSSRGLSVIASAALLSGCTLFTSLGGLSTGDAAPEVAVADGGKSADPGTLTLTCDTAGGEKICFGACSSIRDPQVGCSATDCVACDVRNVDQVVCAGASAGFGCSYGSCAPRYQDCDGDRGNGCELSKNSKAACGDCATKCERATPFCAPLGAGFACVASCPPGTEACDGACVELASDNENCGACGKRCARSGATGRCEGGTCTFQCQRGLKECNGACVSDQDPRFCLACSPCPAPGLNEVQSCSVGACIASCLPNTYDCDGVRANGCESTRPCVGKTVDPCLTLSCTSACCPFVGCCEPPPPPAPPPSE
jgi:hypothetical protein